MVSVRRTFDGIMRRWGHDILLQRRICDGSGHSPTLERHTVRYSYPSTRSMPMIRQEQREGMVHNVDLIYYFRNNANPREGDRIYEHDERYPDEQTIWKIAYALPIRGKNGRIEYYMAGVNRFDPA